ncbi:MAG: nucleotidyltransferase family protein [[Clostridium] fimetarium]|nr:nucleotidyltransferase family protein [Alistipes timonensis]MCM1405816.1 nucleotidyltransferase family protein [[Clostridium] fimetarium]
MKGMIFAAGIGSRLRPFTDHHPKALAPVGGKPMLRRVIEKFTSAGVREIVVNIHHFPDQIKEYLRANDNFGADIAISDESDTLLDTGGGLLKARRWLDGDEPILVHNADILTDFSIAEMEECHSRSGAAATLLAFPRESSRQLYFGEDGSLRGWQNLKTSELKPAGFRPEADFERLAFGGVHIVEPRLFPLLEDYSASVGVVFSIIPFYLATLAKERYNEFAPSGNFAWHDIGTPEKLAAAEAMLKSRS